MAYDINAIRKKIADLSGGRTNSDRPKLNWFKAKIGTYEIRFLPYTDANGQPFQEVSYYNNKQLNENRFVAPAQFGMEDPIFDLLNELRKDNSNDTWKLIGALRPKERFYAPILVRGEEETGVQTWELNPKLLQDIYTILAHPDNAEENLMDPENGYDFTLTVSDSGKKWNGYVVKQYDLLLRRKPTKLANNKKERDELVASVPDLELYFKSLVKSPETLSGFVENFLAARSGEETPDESVPELANTASRGTADGVKIRSIEDAFSDLDSE